MSSRKKQTHMKIKGFFNKIINILSLLFLPSPSESYKPKPGSYTCPCEYHKRKRHEYELQLASRRVVDNIEVHKENSGRKDAANFLFITNGSKQTEISGELIKDGAVVHKEKGKAKGLCITNGNEYVHEEQDVTSQLCDGDGLSWSELYALIHTESDGRGIKGVEFEDVNEKAERFIKNFRENLGIQKTISDELPLE